jgi:hypothetical protein
MVYFFCCLDNGSKLKEYQEIFFMFYFKQTKRCALTNKAKKDNMQKKKENAAHMIFIIKNMYRAANFENVKINEHYWKPFDARNLVSNQISPSILLLSLV